MTKRKKEKCSVVLSVYQKLEKEAALVLKKMNLPWIGTDISSMGVEFRNRASVSSEGEN